MSESYTTGGDTFVSLEEGKWACQSFLPLETHTLEYIDLNLKLFGIGPEPFIGIYYFTPGIGPWGDCLSRNRYWLLQFSLAPRDWPLYEPWGKTLTENYPWQILADPDPPDINIANGILTLIFTGTPHSGITYNPPANHIPLVSPTSQPLRILTDNPKALSLNPQEVIANMVYLTKNGLYLLLYLVIKPPLFGDFSTPYGFTPGPPWWFAWKYIGTGLKDINLLDFFLQAAPDLGFDPDPTGWSVYQIEIAHRDLLPILPSYLQNDRIGLYHSTTPQTELYLGSTGYSWPGKTYRIRFSMQPLTLEKGTYYCILATASPRFGEFAPMWQYDKNDATYPRGSRFYSTDSKITWTEYPNDDHIFAEFGTPPLPKAEPPPPIEHFAIPDITQILTMDGIQLYLPTTVPCHLTCYWTDKKPLKHPLSRTTRGITIPWSTYFCFVAWHAVDQNEPGDTLYHTFTLEPWLECETRWFTFRGNVDTELSPSVGPIFEKHCPGPYTFIKNPSFEDWPIPPDTPTHWAWTSPIHPNIQVWRDSADKTHGQYALSLECTGELGWYRIYQDVDAIPYRGKTIFIKPDMKGKPIWYTGLWVSIDGTPPFYKQERPVSPNYWAPGYITAKVRANSTKIHIELRVDSFLGQPNTCRFDNLRNIVY